MHSEADDIEALRRASIGGCRHAGLYAANFASTIPDTPRTNAGKLLMPSVILVAAIPYMWRLKEPAQPQVENPAAGQFLFASGLFLTSEVAIFYRKLEHHKLVAFCHASGFSAMFIHALQSEINDRATLGHPTDIGLDDEQAKWQLNEVIKPSIRFF